MQKLSSTMAMQLQNKFQTKSKVEQALAHLNDAKQQLTADTTELQTAVQQLNRRGDTNNKSQEVSMHIIKQFNHRNTNYFC